MEGSKKLSVHEKINLRSHWDVNYCDLKVGNSPFTKGRVRIPYDGFKAENNPKYLSNPFSMRMLNPKAQRDKELQFKYKF